MQELKVLISAIEKAQQRGVYTLEEVSNVLRCISAVSQSVHQLEETSKMEVMGEPVADKKK